LQYDITHDSGPAGPPEVLELPTATEVDPPVLDVVEVDEAPPAPELVGRPPLEDAGVPAPVPPAPPGPPAPPPAALPAAQP
jgi:hypothetical protein